MICVGPAVLLCAHCNPTTWDVVYDLSSFIFMNKCSYHRPSEVPDALSPTSMMDRND